MDRRTTADLLLVAVELRLAALENETGGKRLNRSRLMEMADILEGAAQCAEGESGRPSLRLVSSR